VINDVQFTICCHGIGTSISLLLPLLSTINEFRAYEFHPLVKLVIFKNEKGRKHTHHFKGIRAFPYYRIMNRRSFVRLAASSGIMTSALPGFALHHFSPKHLEKIPPKFKAVIDKLLAREPGYWNTNWDGTMAMESLLAWSRRGIPGTLELARQWLDFHIENDNKLSDEEFYDTFSGPSTCRIMRGKYLSFTMYSGFFGLPFPCYE
jgi:hypothetical protein